MSKESRNRDLQEKGFVSKDGYEKLNEELKNEVESKTAAFMERMVEEIESWGPPRISQ
ncbi:MAG: hypothetical protein NXH86_04235 [Flavobacteriaceae bacterium]|nr:hypothetical protein [Flavobacteriaceae bacterium]